MKFFSLQSGSNGNCHLIESNNTTILIDAGISGVKTKRLMEEEGFDIFNVRGVLLTHEHDDHASCAGILARKFKLPIYANRNTFQKSIIKMKAIDESLIHFIEGPFSIGDLYVLPFRTSHDACDPCGYVVKQGDKKITVLTDTGCVKDEVLNVTRNSDIFYVEANFDPIMLKNGPYSPMLQARVRGEFGHLSNFECGEYLINAVGDRTKFIMIGHISYKNNDEMLAKLTVEDMLAKNGIDIPVFVSSRFRKSVVLEI